jgi:hypothetical protein
MIQLTGLNALPELRQLLWRSAADFLIKFALEFLRLPTTAKV